MPEFASAPICSGSRRVGQMVAPMTSGIKRRISASASAPTLRARHPRPNRTKPRRQTIPSFCRPPSPIGRAAPSPPSTLFAAQRAGPRRFLVQRRQRASGVHGRFGGLCRRSPWFWRHGNGLLLLGRQVGRLGRVLHANAPPLHRLLQFRFAFLFDLARCGYHDMADHAAGRLSQFATRCCFWLCNFNYGLGLRAVGCSAAAAGSANV